MIRSRYSYHRLREERHARARLGGNRLLFVGLAVFAVVGLVVARNIGRPYLVLREVAAFLDGIESRPPAEVKRGLSRLAAELDNPNPMIHRAAVGAFQVATGQNLGENPQVWRVWWRAAEPTWEYRPPAARETPP
jgi:hypothetical protein